MQFVESLFPNNTIPLNWMEVFAENVPKMSRMFFTKEGEPYGLIVISEHEDSIFIINSLSKDNLPYSIAMQRMILKFVTTHDKVILMSTKRDSCINRVMKTFIDKGEGSYFTKGV